MSGWRESRLGNEIELAYGKSLPAHARESGPYSVFGSNGVVGKHTDAVVRGPGIIVGRKGSVGEVVYSEEPFWPIDTTYFVVNKGNHDWKYLFHLLRNLGLEGLNSHSAVPGLNREDAYSIDVNWPEPSEQRVIARAIDTIEASVSLEQRALVETMKLKRTAMRELFTCGLRGAAQKETEIGIMPESWAAAAISDITTLVYRYPTYYGITYEKSGVPEIRGELLSRHGEIEADWSKYRFIDETTAAQFPNVRLCSGDIVMSVRGTMGKIGIALEEHTGAVITANLIRLAPKSEVIIPDFFKYALLSERFLNALDAASPQTTIKTIAAPVLRSLKVPLPPSLDEQREIVAILDAIDRKIDLHKRKRAVLEELFKTLLHKLMIGEIRVHDLDLSALKPAEKAEAAA